ncbi:hypothetical protein [Synechococcus sp. PCC 6312]|nr:hypothetical protein [Synechococcus sp. PCC 6312]
MSLEPDLEGCATLQKPVSGGQGEVTPLAQLEQPLGGRIARGGKSPSD